MERVRAIAPAPSIDGCVIYPTALIFDRRVKAIGYVLYTLMVSQPWASLHELLPLLRRTERTANKYVRILCECGYITDRGANANPRYIATDEEVYSNRTDGNLLTAICRAA